MKLTKAQRALQALQHVLVEIDFAEADEKDGIATEQTRRIRFDMIRDAARRGLITPAGRQALKESGHAPE